MKCERQRYKRMFCYILQKKQFDPIYDKNMTYASISKQLEVIWPTLISIIGCEDSRPHGYDLPLWLQ